MKHETGIPEFLEVATEVLERFRVIHELCQTDLTDAERRVGLRHVVEGLNYLQVYCKKCSSSLQEQTSALN